MTSFNALDALEPALHKALRELNDVEQILGKALGYPWFRDDLANFPEATDADGVDIGEHTAVTLAQEAASLLEKLREPGFSLRALLFYRHAQLWHDETDGMSSPSDKAFNPHYQAIIAMGPEVVSLIMDDLARTGGDWYIALRQLVPNPPTITPEMTRSSAAVRQAWLDWWQGVRAYLTS